MNEKIKRDACVVCPGASREIILSPRGTDCGGDEPVEFPLRAQALRRSGLEGFLDTAAQSTSHLSCGAHHVQIWDGNLHMSHQT